MNCTFGGFTLQNEKRVKYEGQKAENKNVAESRHTGQTWDKDKRTMGFFFMHTYFFSFSF